MNRANRTVRIRYPSTAMAQTLCKRHQSMPNNTLDKTNVKTPKASNFEMKTIQPARHCTDKLYANDLYSPNLKHLGNSTRYLVPRTGAAGERTRQQPAVDAPALQQSNSMEHESMTTRIRRHARVWRGWSLT